MTVGGKLITVRGPAPSGGLAQAGTLRRQSGRLDITRY